MLSESSENEAEERKMQESEAAEIRTNRVEDVRSEARELGNEIREEEGDTNKKSRRNSRSRWRRESA